MDYYIAPLYARILLVGIVCLLIIRYLINQVYYYSIDKKERKRRKKTRTFKSALFMTYCKDIVPADFYVWYYVQLVLTVVATVLSIPSVSFAVKNPEKLFDIFFWISGAPIMLYWIMYLPLNRGDAMPRWMRKK